MKKTKESILQKHFEKEYGFKIPKKNISGFKYVFDSMIEYRNLKLGEEGPEEEPEEENPGPDNPKLLNHQHIPFMGGWLTWRNKKQATREQLTIISKLYDLARALDPLNKTDGKV